MTDQPINPAATAASTRAGAAAGTASVLSAIREAASKAGASFDALLASAKIESGLNPNAKAATSSATGLFQFVDQTWLAAVKRSGAEHGLAAQAASIVRRGGQLTVDDPATRQEILDLRKDPKIAAAMAADHLTNLSAQLAQSLGHAPSVTETYMGHFLGAGGATQMLQALQNSPNAPASSILPDAARANPAMFSGQTVQQFVNKVGGRVSQAYAELGMPVPQGPVQLGGFAPKAANFASADSGSDGWGSSTPTNLSTTPERLMLSSLSQVFTRVDRGVAAQREQNGAQNQGQSGKQPTGVVSSLDTTAGATSTYGI